MTITEIAATGKTIDTWIAVAASLPFEDLCRKPSPEEWSLGQVCVHIVEETTFYIGQMNLCLLSDLNQTEGMNARGKMIFSGNAFPDERIKSDLHISYYVPQPVEKGELTAILLKLKSDLDEIGVRIAHSPSKGKTPHPGLGYFTAEEWFRYADMHMRHHFRQKARLLAFLASR
jgi:hypothetical protein